MTYKKSPYWNSDGRPSDGRPWYPRKTRKRRKKVEFAIKGYQPCPSQSCEGGFVHDTKKNITRICLYCKGVGQIKKAA